MSIIYHKNNKVAWNGTLAYHSNGSLAWNGTLAYHSNGKLAWNGKLAYHSNDKLAWNGAVAYYNDGANAGTKGIELQLGEDIKMDVGKDGMEFYVLGNIVASK